MKWFKYKKIYFSLSGVLIFISVISLISWGMRLGIDFTGGTIIEYRPSVSIGEGEIKDAFNKNGVQNVDVEFSGSTFSVKTGVLSEENKLKAESELKNKDKDLQELRYEVVGPAIGPELVQKTINAILASSVVILFWVAFQFKNIKYGLSAVLAMFHDSLIVLGAFSLMGHFWAVEIDFLFVTAVLTILSFSVHDTIVVFDRIRENLRGGDKMSFGETVGISTSQTIVRSINITLTIIFVLVPLYLFGPETTKNFALILTIGLFFGIYSSLFFASPLLILIEEWQAKKRK